MAKRNRHAKTGIGVENPLDAIHMGDGKHIRLESDAPDDADAHKRLFNRLYNDIRYFRDALVNANNASGDNPFATIADLPIIDPTLPDGLLEGGIVQWKQTGYDFEVSTALVRENGILDIVEGKDFTLDPSDPTNPRKDVPNVSLSFGFQELKGEPAVNPIEPQPEPPRIRLTAIDVAAGSTEPADINTTVVYKENLEYVVTHAGTGSSDPDNLLFPFEGLKAVNVSAVEHNSSTIFTAPADVAVSDHSSGSLRLRLKEFFANGHNITVQFLDASDNPVSSQQTLFINKTLVNEYQYVAFSFDQFNFGTNTTFRKILLRFLRTGNQQTRQGYFIDNFILQGGITQPPRVSINYTTINHGDLVNLISNNDLSEGQMYLISDFRTRHQIPNTTDIHEGAIEPLVVFSTGKSSISENAYSLVYPKDEIKYDPVGDAFSTYGKITFRRDIELNTDAYYDFREVRFRRFKILSKQEEEITSLTSNTLDCLLTFSTGTNLSGTFFTNTNRRLHVQVGAINHDAGELTLTVRKGTGSITKPILKYDGTAWTENELANTSGILTNCLVRDAYVFMNYKAGGFGKEVVGTYSSPVSTTYTLGDGLRYIVDPLDFTDYLTFNNTYFGVHIDKFNNAFAGNNIIFLSTVNMAHFGENCYNDTFRGLVINFFSGHELINNIFVGQVTWSTFRKEAMNSYWAIGFNYCNINEHVIRNTIYTPQFGFITEFEVRDNTIHFNGSFVKLLNFVENSGIFLNGTFGPTGRSSTIFTSIITNSLIGYFNADNLILNKRLLNTSFYEVPAVHNYVRSLNIEESPSPTGTVKILGWDEKGNVIRTENISGDFVSYNENDQKNITQQLQARDNIDLLPIAGYEWAPVTVESGWQFRFGVVYGNGKFIFFANENTGTLCTRVYISDDGFSWRIGATIDPVTIRDVSFGKGRFVAIATEGTDIVVLWSDNGTEWNSFVMNPSTNGNFAAICYGGDQFVVVATSGTNRIATSPDGINWTYQSPPTTRSWFNVHYGNGVYVAVSSTDRLIYSFDAVTWVEVTISLNNWQGISYGNGIWVVGRTTFGTSYYTSTDGINWTLRTFPVSTRADKYTLVFGRGLFVITTSSSSNPRILTSKDGINWRTRGTFDIEPPIIHLAYGGGVFVGGTTEGIVYVSGYSANNQLTDYATKLMLNEAIITFNESQLVSSAAPIKFDVDYQIGSSLTPISSDITFDLTDATVGSATSVFHQAATAPALGTNIKKVFIGFAMTDYGENVLNELTFHYMEDPNNSDEPYLKVYHSKNITVENAI